LTDCPIPPADESCTPATLSVWAVDCPYGGTTGVFGGMVELRMSESTRAALSTGSTGGFVVGAVSGIGGGSGGAADEAGDTCGSVIL
jgi:hypothetical protein